MLATKRKTEPEITPLKSAPDIPRCGQISIAIIIINNKVILKLSTVVNICNKRKLIFFKINNASFKDVGTEFIAIKSLGKAIYNNTDSKPAPKTIGAEPIKKLPKD